MKKTLYLALLGSVVSVAAIIPVVASAKAPLDEHAYVNEHSYARAEVAATTTCPTSAFGHLIAPGWLRKNSQASTTLSTDCFLPFGIGKLIYGTSTDHGTSTHSTSTVPFSLRISDIDTDAGTSSAAISWHTNAAADSQVYYSTSSPVVIGATSTTAAATNAMLVRDHSMTLNDLATSTTYHVVVRSADAQGDTATSAQFDLVTR